MARVLGPLSADPTSQVSKASGGDGLSTSEHALLLIHDQLATANWQRGGGKKAKRPEPISPLISNGKKKSRFGRTDLSPEEAVSALKANNPRGDHGD